MNRFLKHSILFVSLNLIFAVQGFALSGYFLSDSNCIQAYNYVYDLQFDKARGVLQQYKQTHPNNLIPLHIENTIDFLTLFISEDDEQYASLSENEKLRLQRIQDAEHENEPYFRYVQADILLQWAFVRMKFGDYLSAANEIYQAYDLLEQNMAEYPLFDLNKKGMGILHALVGTIPDNYRWLVQVVGMDGTIDQGVSELDDFFDYAQKEAQGYLITEAYFYQSFLSTNLLNDEKRWVSLAEKGKALVFGKSPLVVFARVSLLKKLGRNDEVINLLQNRVVEPGQYPFYYLSFLLGEAYLYKLDMRAISCFGDYVHGFKGRHYIKAAWLRMAWAHLIAGDEKNYVQALNNIAKYGRSDVGDDQYASKQFDANAKPALPLLKARLLFDGGYYVLSLKALEAFHPSLQRNKAAYVEVHYRKARNYHELKQYKEALGYYRIVYAEGKTQDDYYAANAALMMGMIYEKLGKNKLAVASYNQCLDMPNCSYKNGIDQKAKAGLERVGR